MVEISDKTHSYIPLNKIIGVVPEIIKENARLLQDNQSKGYILYVVNDIQNNTHFYDLRKKLRVKGYEHIVEYSNRQHIEKINHIFNTSEHENDADQTDIQDKILLIIKTAVEMRSSDIHIQIGSFTQVYFRIDGSRNVMQQFENTVENGQRLVQTLFNSMCTERSSSTFSYNEPCDAKIREEYVQAYGLSTGRFASRPGSSGKVIVVIRLISRRKQSLTLGELGLSEAQQNAIKRSLAKPAGVILSSGPTGHGKSTLSQCMAEIYTSENPGMNMLSVEDPIESPIEGTFQTPLIIADRSDSSKMGRAWGKSMSNLMRLDPDCIYIGEVRDNTSGNGVIEAAQTGHIVVTTIHTNHPIDIIQRLRRWGVDQDLLTDATLITCLIGLRLVKKLCPICKLSYVDHRQIVDSLFHEVIDKYTNINNVYLVNSKGCDCCNYTGIKGRTGVFEVIETDYEFMKLYEKEGKFAAYAYWRRNGGITLCQNAIQLINDGIIDPIITHKSICNLDRDDKFL
ncbi:GspE/PulE family protein [Photorhabdus temperata]|uniref:Bacterial type II secretion system protein E domain-containing protein n=1 Tax=Photorhabdus temperata J3 TaxID=1389415 RepID=U7R885_PHOTE|nr:ATPase, T2SS/T4P/T4SS family [Photorhabdus temperata]ERT14896.1 hypothetical protein O185_01140 [Photorhabdus temperata J3]